MTMQAHRAHALRWWSLTTVMAIGIAAGVSAYDHVTDELTRARSDRDALATQVRGLGATPVAGTPGRDGQAGPQGVPGRRGADGRNGADGKDGTDGKVGPAGAAGPRGATGPSGAPGAPGPSGDMGDQGPVGPSGPPGPQGEKGDKGDTGDTVMCPGGYTATEVTVMPHPGTYMICKKDDTE